MRDSTDHDLAPQHRKRRIEWVVDGEGEGGHWSLDPHLSRYFHPATDCQPARAPEWKSANRLHGTNEEETQ